MTRNGATLAEARLPVELLCMTGVHKYHGSGLSAVHALHDINLCVMAGEVVAICGPSGSGKTSLLNLAGMLELASEGSVVIAHLLVAKLSEQARADLRAETIGYVFQSSNLIPVMTAQENVMLPLLLRGHMDRAAVDAARLRSSDLLGRLGLATQASHYPARLDASQSQRVAIARALMTRPRLVIADEPTSRLDHGCTRMVMELFASHQREHNTAFLLATRDQRQHSRVTRTLQLTEGRLHAVPTDPLRSPLRVHV